MADYIPQIITGLAVVGGSLVGGFVSYFFAERSRARDHGDTMVALKRAQQLGQLAKNRAQRRGLDRDRHDDVPESSSLSRP